MFSLWNKNHRGTLKNKPIFKKLWMALPKYLCWKTWLARNRVIFKQDKNTPRSVAAKAKGLLAEFINSKQTVNLMHEIWMQKRKDGSPNSLSLISNLCHLWANQPLANLATKNEYTRIFELAALLRNTYPIFLWSFQRKSRGGKCRRGHLGPKGKSCKFFCLGTRAGIE